ncbi:dipeptidase PepE [Pantoea sp. Mb-10]|uniref:dipeptidase PepE n=1 Tax=unclassified Pantoea TaxID=2630326 RepID=UPI001E44DBC7|nr:MULTISPECIES: dipeptidase PepE [unclassified Pantoea]MCE0491625.1 dipeptidase PepE [Pantoea sp. Mb-10]MCE0502812.1 dipeptidase PepE [Pantoea sp. Pb-8]
MELFLLSNGRMSSEAPLLSYAHPQLHATIARRGITSAVLVPYAILRGDPAQRAQELTDSLGITVRTLGEFASPRVAIEQAELILVSGGNTWFLNQMLHEQGLIVPIQRAVRERNVPYVGWSAGCNVATPSIRTTNDMPVRSSVVLPALGLFPVQINPHYLDAHVSGHMGETRDERLAEFCAVNPDESVIALREGSFLHVSDNHFRYYSARGEDFKVFRHHAPIAAYHDTLPLQPLVPFVCATV